MQTSGTSAIVLAVYVPCLPRSFSSFFLNPASEAEPRPPALRVLILDGASVEIYHSWELTTTILKAELESTGRFDVTVLTAPPFGQNFGGFDPHFERYQAVVWNYDAPDWPLLCKLNCKIIWAMAVVWSSCMQLTIRSPTGASSTK